MITLLTDTHTHTLASGHAYSTLEENLKAAKEGGLELLAITDHFSEHFVPNTNFASYGFFLNKKALPKEVDGVRLLFGAEVDIVDMEGRLFGYHLYSPYKRDGIFPTYEEAILNKLDFLIASVHYKEFTANTTVAEKTELYIKALEHEKVKVLGHIGRSDLKIEIDEVVKAAKSANKMIEINEASFAYGEHIANRCKQIALSCAKHGTKVTVSSDAHSSFFIGKFPKVQALFDEINFPIELIASRDKTSFLEAIGLPD